MPKRQLLRKLQGGILILSLFCIFLPYFKMNVWGNTVSTVTVLSLSRGVLENIPYLADIAESLSYPPAFLVFIAVLYVILAWSPFVLSAISGIRLLADGKKREWGLQTASLILRIVLVFVSQILLMRFMRLFLGDDYQLQVSFLKFLKAMGWGFWLGIVLQIAALVLGAMAGKEELPSIDREKQAFFGGVSVLSGLMQGARIPLAPGEAMIVGRDGTLCNLVINSPKVSRKHCEIRWDDYGKKYLVTDYSSNGTKLGSGERLSPHTPMRIPAGSILELGDSGERLRLESDGE